MAKIFADTHKIPAMFETPCVPQFFSIFGDD
jgi:hypothetical protein